MNEKEKSKLVFKGYIHSIYDDEFDILFYEGLLEEIFEDYKGEEFFITLDIEEVKKKDRRKIIYGYPCTWIIDLKHNKDRIYFTNQGKWTAADIKKIKGQGRKMYKKFQELNEG